LGSFGGVVVVTIGQKGRWSGWAEGWPWKRRAGEAGCGGVLGTEE